MGTAPVPAPGTPLPEAPRPTPPLSKPRSALAQLAIVCVALAIGVVTAVHLFQARPLRVGALGVRTFAARTIASGPNPARDILFVGVTLQAEDPASVAATVNELEMTLIDAAGDRTTIPQVGQINSTQLAATYPALRAMLASPLLRNTLIAPGKSVTGTAVFAIYTTGAAWRARRSALVKLKYNHTEEVSVPLPGDNAP